MGTISTPSDQTSEIPFPSQWLREGLTVYAPTGKGDISVKYFFFLDKWMFECSIYKVERIKQLVKSKCIKICIQREGERVRWKVIQKLLETERWDGLEPWVCE